MRPNLTINAINISKIRALTRSHVFQSTRIGDP